jgi:hypothetical protein
MLNLAGRYEEKPASDPDGFLRFAEGLSTPTVYNAIKCAERPPSIGSINAPWLPSVNVMTAFQSVGASSGITKIALA